MTTYRYQKLRKREDKDREDSEKDEIMSQLREEGTHSAPRCPFVLTLCRVRR